MEVINLDYQEVMLDSFFIFIEVYSGVFWFFKIVILYYFFFDFFIYILDIGYKDIGYINIWNFIYNIRYYIYNKILFNTLYFYIF
jgi:hypothetical protein